MTAGDHEKSSERGLYDGFEGYRTPTQDDYRSILNDGMVSIDANLLLDLYRYNEKTRGDLLSVMAALGSRLWVSHQVLEEFWRNRESALSDPKRTRDTLVDELQVSAETATKAIRTWANRVSLPQERRLELIAEIDGAFERVKGQINAQTDSAITDFSRDTNHDAILTQLSQILAGCAGNPLSGHDYAIALEEAARRVQAKEPPGYRDRKKGENAAGDYLVWEQLLREAELRNCDVIFVTSDVKEDWWRIVEGEARGPRLELIEEFKSRTGRQILFLRPTGLLRQAESLLNVPVDPTSVDEIERVDRIRADTERSRVTAEASTLGQIPSDIRELLLVEIYQQAHDIGWESLSNAEKTSQYRKWIEDPKIGGVLTSFMREENARVWIKDVPMKEYARAQEGFGPYARYAVMRFKGADEVVEAACGSGWDVVPDSLGEKPMHCLATDGLSTRYVCWGRPGSFRDLVWAAMNHVAEGQEAPAVVITTREGEEVREADREQQMRTADRSGVLLTYLRREMTPNPDLER
ncbi:PIN domain-containing protein [Kitasatospora cathayae]|uniref:PIN domain-containing protein n=1 Tax=Kitasatospora cathayae TaxID=3004092 RepID=A0ABY7Q5X1_9ACTN|nr:PIN domain-containing protein [Kitasatospora sp. HUAS 3-15]WBP88095.1 PIN domain-containing protein [Kitasatospora sp. HUAS 3-15]